jgi:transposase
MADNNVSFRERAIIGFLVKEEISAANIHHRLQRLYGDMCVGASSDRRWVEHFKDGNTSVQNQPGSGRPRTASTEPDKKSLAEIIKEERRVTLDAIATKL